MFFQVIVEGNKKKKEEMLNKLKDGGYFISGSDGEWIIKGVGARLFENEKNGVSFEIQAIRLTEKRILEFPDFIKIISSEITDKLELEGQKDATAVLGVGMLGKLIAYSTAKFISEKRGNESACRGVYAKSYRLLISLEFVLEDGFYIKPNDHLIFVHCDFDKPIFKKSNHLEKLLRGTNTKVMQTIILPTPLEQYQAFLESIYLKNIDKNN